ncbi:hypothetical protein Bca101_032300 [Brassica carinata]
MFFSFIVDLYLLHLISILCWFGDSLAPPPLVIHLELVSFTEEQCDHRSYRYNATVMIISPDEAIIASTKGFSKDTDLLLGIGEEEIEGLIEQHGGGVRLFERRADEEKVEEAAMGEGVERDREEERKTKRRLFRYQITRRFLDLFVFLILF